MMPMGLEEIARAVGGRLTRADGLDVNAPVATSAVSDSRQAGAGSVFVAIAGEHVDGHDFVGAVAGQGAACALVDHEVDAPIAQIVVPDTVAALGLLAKHNLERRRAESSPFSIVGITGSVGKTTTKDLLSHLLGDLGETVAPVGSFNNEIGLPLTALKVNAGTRFFVAEMGANHVGEIARLTTIAPPDVAVVLKVGVAHLGEFGSVERIAQAKSEIVRGLLPGGVSVLNADDAHVAAMKAIAPGKVRWFGLADDLADGRADDARCIGTLTARDITQDETGHPAFSMIAADPAGGRAETAVSLGIRGRHNVMNALAAASVALQFGMPLERIALVLASQHRISAHRMAVSAVERDGASFTLIDDSFNANPDSMRAGLDGLAAWHASDADKPYRIAVLGAMLELGGDEADLHRQMGRYAVEVGADAVVAVGGTDPHLDELASDLAQGARDAAAGRDGVSVDWVHGADEADTLVMRLAAEHTSSVVLLKGSHASGLSALASRWAPQA
ncbi:UDP-N-acetylmuramoyl-tripeptide--D-alanyl-D-alanine ligase [Bifidobacterium simiiventris]|uniref:UDP-N-acetylmuramoyl-tripeptide--D-alanyl-D- alanine ligase n=1 Tax=Bifidobacterium simiiventris TaxID=2834434 RepID=UPI001C5938EB|nr:UDP-N-acetylmuramoyl-tripeptide--D-alanyl-D-alanine ligase [Bifidobacterium simiiventris]MBW3077749.1 UDP-N-acetylmuramoyl-tripeptide--D-alanyl-D-alanine ligase [Bifidobacterium simiiventris]